MQLPIKMFGFLGVCLMALVLTGCDKAEMADIQSNGVSLKDDSGRWLVVNIWAEWCDPCREEIPELNALGNKGDIRVLGYDFDGSQGAELKKKVATLGIEFPVLTDSPLSLLDVKTPQVLPATLIVNPEGKLVEVVYGPQSQSSLEKKVKRLQQKVGANG